MRIFVDIVLIIGLSGALHAVEHMLSFRIIDGNLADITEFPHQVSIRFNGTHHCGGSIISPRHILTAAHCTFGVPKEYFTVRVGSNTIAFGGSIHAVQKVSTHPNFTVRFENDVAVMKLWDTLEYNDKVQPIQLVNENDKLPEEGTIGLVSGWGRTQANNSDMSPHLMTLEMPLLAHKVCKSMYAEKQYVIDNKMFCAGYLDGGADSCLGDSGGAFVVDGVQHGIVSWGVGCGVKNRPGVYASVARLRKYIHQVSGV